MNREQISAEVIFLAESIINCDVTEKTQLDEVADSLDLVELIMRVESECKVDIFDEDVFKMKTPADLIDYVNTKLNGQV